MSGSPGKDENRDKKISLDVAQFVTVLNVKKKNTSKQTSQKTKLLSDTNTIKNM